ncbi:hypothetical protein [Thermococcus barophilus]|uniref:Uncharacterized protein n=1 Tax=Thermococcus barophilus (strain DSM 11836 / MP) TaxID=391623 RepID=F0LKK3_THEBM|nr:hypothetical protein [Thermococcus barophilus]ADT84837.1 hypothetical protein TERMP_01862 [Thermococcus barophilus MP]
MRQFTIFRKLEEIDRIRYVFKEFFEKLEKIVPSLVTEDGILEIFEQDMELIQEMYNRGEISRKEALQLLRELDEVADDLEEYVLRVRERLIELERENLAALGKLRKSIEPPQIGIPIVIVKEKIKDSIRKIAGSGLPKKDFGILNVSDYPRNYCKEEIKEKILGFLEEYSSGIVIARSELKECIMGILSERGMKFEVKEMGTKTIFIVEG